MLFGRYEICLYDLMRYEICLCVGRQKCLCESCLIRLTSMHDTKSIRMFEDDFTSSEHALVIQGGSLGGVGVGGVMYAI